MIRMSSFACIQAVSKICNYFLLDGLHHKTFYHGYSCLSLAQFAFYFSTQSASLIELNCTKPALVHFQCNCVTHCLTTII